MIPWDFGLIDALKARLDLDVFPSEPPEESKNIPYLILELKNIKQGTNQTVRVEIQLKIVNKNHPANAIYEFIMKINKAISQKLDLYQGDFEIGKANVKMEKVAMTKNDTVMNLTALLSMKAIYEDAENADDEAFEAPRSEDVSDDGGNTAAVGNFGEENPKREGEENDQANE